MAAYIGKISEFHSEIMKWEIYMTRVKMFFETNDITSETKKRAVLLTSMGKKANTSLSSLTAPKIPA